MNTQKVPWLTSHSSRTKSHQFRKTSLCQNGIQSLHLIKLYLWAQKFELYVILIHYKIFIFCFKKLFKNLKTILSFWDIDGGSNLACGSPVPDLTNSNGHLADISRHHHRLLASTFLELLSFLSQFRSGPGGPTNDRSWSYYCGYRPSCTVVSPSSSENL